MRRDAPLRCAPATRDRPRGRPDLVVCSNIDHTLLGRGLVTAVNNLKAEEILRPGATVLPSAARVWAVAVQALAEMRRDATRRDEDPPPTPRRCSPTRACPLRSTRSRTLSGRPSPAASTSTTISSGGRSKCSQIPPPCSPSICARARGRLSQSVECRRVAPSSRDGAHACRATSPRITHFLPRPRRTLRSSPTGAPTPSSSGLTCRWATPAYSRPRRRQLG